MSKTSDNDKKAKDNQAKREKRNEDTRKNASKHSYSEKTDHL